MEFFDFYVPTLFSQNDSSVPVHVPSIQSLRPHDAASIHRMTSYGIQPMILDYAKIKISSATLIITRVSSGDPWL